MEKQLSYEDIRKMRRWVNSYEIYNFPFMTDVQIAVRVVTQDELLKAINKGREKAEVMFKKPSGEDIEKMAMRELLYNAILVVPNGEERIKFFDSPEMLWDLSLDEVNLLTEHYEAVQEKYAPWILIKTEEDFELMISELKKKSLIGMSLSTYTLQQLLWYLIETMKILPSDNDTISTPVSKSKENEKKNRTNLPKVGISLKPKNM